MPRVKRTGGLRAIGGITTELTALAALMEFEFMEHQLERAIPEVGVRNSFLCYLWGIGEVNAGLVTNTTAKRVPGTSSTNARITTHTSDKINPM
jgi:hypothetical protein